MDTINPKLPVIKLKIVRNSNHPWIFQKMIEKPDQKIPNGCIVDIEDRAGAWVGRGIFNGHSRISLRILTTIQNEQIDETFFDKKIGSAVGLRKEILNLEASTNAYRLIHGEGDGLSGLIVDKFGKTIVVEFFSSGMYRLKDTIQTILLKHYPNHQITWFAESHVQKQESFNCKEPEYIINSEIINENGLSFKVTPGTGHKTGFFADQRENRLLLSSFCTKKKVLDLCCNSGGFSVYAKVLGKAEDVTAIDLDEEVLALARHNASLNKVRIKCIQSDIFPWLRDCIAKGEKFDVVILDPSKLTRDRDEIEMALRKYTDMNRLAMQVVCDGGILLTCSCTGLVSEFDFFDSVRKAAWQAGKTAQILKLTGAGPDHPFMAHAGEGRYLKAIFARIHHGTT
ncbi:MAG: class I SAM-dependent rRNA methyltransferase [Planctomycetes bacterium]|nr:class I SAM-dependent rRNA methyltransferase [Planctomycetota bacterium]